MSQDMEDFPSTEKIRLSRPKIKAWLESLRSSWSGTSHPASPVAGQTCWRTDLSAYAYYNGSAWKKLIVALKTAYVIDALSSVAGIDGAALLDDGQICLVLGRAASGDQLPTVLVWDADSSATHDGWSVWRPSSGAASTGDGRFLRLAASPSQTFTSGDATPSIANGSFFVTAGTTAITDFDDAFEGQQFTVERGASDIVITHNASLIDCGSASVTLTANAPRATFRHVGGVHKLLTFGSANVDDAWADLASASTTDLASIAGANIRITGTTTITALGTAPAGRKKRLRFAGALTLTHNGTSLILPGATSIVTTAEDEMEAVSLGGGNWVVAPYFPATAVKTDRQQTFTRLQQINLTAAQVAATGDGILFGRAGSSGSPIATDGTYGYTGASFAIQANPTIASSDPFVCALQGATTFQAGGRSLAVGVLASGDLSGSYTPTSQEGSAVALFTSGGSSRGGGVFGAGFHAGASTTNGASIRGIEIDTISSASTVASNIGIELVSPSGNTATVTGTVTLNGGLTAPDNFGIRIGAIGAGNPWATAIGVMKFSGGAAPIPTTGQVFRTGGFTCLSFLDARDAVYSEAALRLGPGVAVAVATGNAGGRLQGHYNLSGGSHDHFFLSVNTNPASSGARDNSALGTAQVELVGTNSGGGTIYLSCGAVNTAPTARATVTVTGIGSGIAPLHKFHGSESATNVECASFDATSGSYGYSVIKLDCARAANSGYNFLACRSGVGGSVDTEFRLQGDGNGYADGSWTGGGADYAEFFEWADGNPDHEDRRGYSVALVGSKIVLASEAPKGAPIIGIISANPTVVGDAAWNHWSEKYLRDEFNAYVMEEYAVLNWEALEPTGETKQVNVYEESYVLEEHDTIVDGVVVREMRSVLKRDPVFDVMNVLDPDGKQVMTEEFIEEDYEVSFKTETGEKTILKSRLVSTGKMVPLTKTVQRSKTEPVMELRKHSYAEDAVPEGVVVPADAGRATTDINGRALKRRVLNPAYDPDRPYDARIDRPEWDTVGLMGKLRLRAGQPVGDRWIRMRDVTPEIAEYLVR